MIEVTVGVLAAELGAALTEPASGRAVVSSVTADSRQVGPGSLFVALAGARVDGHDFVAGALADGAVAALTARPVAGVPCLVVADPLRALGRLARGQVDRAAPHGLRVIGITGSQGKTSTKDLLAQVCEAAGPTVAPRGNLNNELGVPLTVAQLDADTRFLVVEMGARGVGHIRYLCEIAPPRVGVVLNVGHAHVGEFGGREATALAKGELVEALPADGAAVLNADDALVWAMRTRTAASVLGFSIGGPPPGDGVWATDLHADPAGRYSFRLHSTTSSRSEVEVQLRGLGRHQVANALAAAAAGLASGLELDAVGAALAAATSRSRWRMEVGTRADGGVVVNDAYNANPESMAAALDVLVELRPPGGRTWAVLGDMLELGDAAQQAHADLGVRVGQHGIDRLLVLGAHAAEVVSGAAAAGLGPAYAQSVPDRETALGVLEAELRPGDVVLVKASRGLALDVVADALLAAPEGEDPA